MSVDHSALRYVTGLDAVGNVTKAASKGFAIGGSALACFVLFQAFLDEIAVFSKRPFDNISKHCCLYRAHGFTVDYI